MDHRPNVLLAEEQIFHLHSACAKAVLYIHMLNETVLSNQHHWETCSWFFFGSSLSVSSYRRVRLKGFKLKPQRLLKKCKAPAKQSQHLNATDRNIVGCNMLHVFGHLVATCCDMLRVENRTSSHAQAQHCCMNLANRVHHDATSTNVAWNIWPVSTLSQQHPICRNRLGKRA